jgi:predicted acetyltransferase
MDLEMRPLNREELPQVLRLWSLAFGEETQLELLEAESKLLPLDRSVAAFDGRTMVGVAAAFPLEMTIPGSSAPTAGVTWVAVLPTHRRRGVLTAMMRHQLNDIRDRGEALAALWASESLIYGRFGYGMATLSLLLDIERRHAALRPNGVETPDVGAVRLVEADEFRRLARPVFNDVCVRRSGTMARDDGWWDYLLIDSEHRRGGAGPRKYVVYECANGCEGYLSYRIKEDWDAFPQNQLRVSELEATTARAQQALWSYALNIDLTETVRAGWRPVDEPLLWMLSDPRRLVATVRDNLWVRLVDVANALAARRYSVEGELVIEVEDAFCPWNTGRYLLQAGPEGARCALTSARPALRLSAADLAAAYLGGVSLTALAAAGRVEESAAGALTRADAMFEWQPAPFCPTVF